MTRNEGPLVLLLVVLFALAVFATAGAAVWHEIHQLGNQLDQVNF